MRNPDYMTMMQGDDGTPGSAELVAAYERGIDELREAVAGMTPMQVLARPVPGRWGTVECVGHLADTEIFFTDRIVRTVAMDRPLLMSADEKQYTHRAARLPGVRPGRATGPVHGPAAARRPHPPGAAARG